MRIFLIGLLLCLCMSLSAQNDKIYLKNGSLLRGTIHEDEPEDTIFIQLSEHVMTVPLDIVDEIRFKKRNGVRREPYQDFMYPVGFATAFEMGVLIGDHSAHAPIFRPTLELTQEYHYHPFLNGGLGIGMHFYERYMTFPVTLDYQALLGNRHKSLLLYARAGYGFIKGRLEQENNELNGGLILRGGIGWQLQVTPQNMLRIRFGYSTQKTTEKQELSPSNYITRYRHLNRLHGSVAYVLR